MLGQRVLAAVVRAYVTVEVEQAQRLGLGLGPALGQALVQHTRQTPVAHLGQLAAQRLDLRDSVETQQQAQFAGRVTGQLFGTLNPQQRHEGQGQQHRAQTEKAVAQGAEHVLRDLEQSLTQQSGQGQQHARTRHRLDRPKHWRGFVQVARARQRPLFRPLHGHALRAGLILVGPLRRRGCGFGLRRGLSRRASPPRRRGLAQTTLTNLVAQGALGEAHLLGGPIHRPALLQAALRPQPRRLFQLVGLSGAALAGVDGADPALGQQLAVAAHRFPADPQRRRQGGVRSQAHLTEHARRQAHPVAIVETTAVDGIRGAVRNQALVVDQDRQARADDVRVGGKTGRVR